MKMSDLQFGDIIVIEYPYTDYSDSKKRPCLLLKDDREDMLVCFISSQLDLRSQHDIIIKKDSQNHLRADSMIKIGKINVVHKLFFHKKIGTLPEHNKQEVKNALLQFVESL